MPQRLGARQGFQDAVRIVTATLAVVAAAALDLVDLLRRIVPRLHQCGGRGPLCQKRSYRGTNARRRRRNPKVYKRGRTGANAAAELVVHAGEHRPVPRLEQWRVVVIHAIAYVVPVTKWLGAGRPAAAVAQGSLKRRLRLVEVLQHDAIVKVGAPSHMPPRLWCPRTARDDLGTQAHKIQPPLGCRGCYGVWLQLLLGRV